MALTETILFYLVVGVAVAVAVFIVDDRLRTAERLFRTATAIIFWPLFMPILLSRSAASELPREPENNLTEPTDEIAAAVRQVQCELDAALASLDGWAEDALARERDRLDELQAAWTAQAARIRDLDRLLAQAEFARSAPQSDSTNVPISSTDETDSAPLNDRLRQSERARRQNIDRLHKVRREAYHDLMGTLAWVRELVTMIHLAKFTGAPASRAEELISQIAAAIEGMSEVTAWRDEPLVSA